MKAKCFSNKSAEQGITIDKSYVIFAGTCIEDKYGYKTITNIYIQDDLGSLGIYNVKYFNIQSISFDKYSFVSENQAEFLFDTIAYDGFWSKFYSDSPEGLEDYLKAKQDFKKAKMLLYREYTSDELRLRILTESFDERDFIFEFLRVQGNDSFIELAIGLIKDGIEKGVKYYDVEEIFRYLASLKNELVNDFFIEYMSDDVWENENINDIVYNYF